MKIFDPYIDELRTLIDALSKGARHHTAHFAPERTWPKGRSGEIVLADDTAIELGHPQTESVAFLMWTDSLEKINDGEITIIGPDLNELERGRAPFGKVVLIGAEGFDEANAYERWQQLNQLRLSLNLSGHMLRAVPQQNREWSRISKVSLDQGLSLEVIGNELLRAYKGLDFVTTAEVAFVTSTATDVQRLREPAAKVWRITNAMNRILDELEMDCGACDLSEVCDEIEGLRELHGKAAQKS